MVGPPTSPVIVYETMTGGQRALRLNILRQQTTTNPLAKDFGYEKAFKCMDYHALRYDFHNLKIDSKD
jgi:catalase (peroxidase I)